jgi:hypothetical protein
MANSEYSLCESVLASGSSPWHIRKLSKKGKVFGGGADTRSLCGMVMSWDMKNTIEGNEDFCCKDCLRAYLEIKNDE